jgi:hypothetical protein
VGARPRPTGSIPTMALTGDVRAGAIGTETGKSWVTDEWARVPQVAAAFDSNSILNEIETEFKSFPKFDRFKKDFFGLKKF